MALGFLDCLSSQATVGGFLHERTRGEPPTVARSVVVRDVARKVDRVPGYSLIAPPTVRRCSRNVSEEILRRYMRYEPNCSCARKETTARIRSACQVQCP